MFSDNYGQFTSVVFRKFCKSYGNYRLIHALVTLELMGKLRGLFIPSNKNTIQCKILLPYFDVSEQVINNDSTRPANIMPSRRLLTLLENINSDVKDNNSRAVQRQTEYYGQLTSVVFIKFCKSYRNYRIIHALSLEN
ncbi:hypothetical protein RF11_14784 [Thelohanellus kitauei]|uniref:Uncharacterized protein n=1 Tax=Thelohanellus kitauei TaxID=669202 RepID=A0A0C2IVY2_THEKT|nr:hypothetical protein RF11_14784 [Thelohanellus kitauei]